jgi:hypothetical protein
VVEIDVSSIQGCEVDGFSSEGDELMRLGMVDEHIYRL